MVHGETQLDLIDPEPIILAIMIIAASAGATSAIVALRRQRRETKEAQKEFSARRDKVKRALKQTRDAHRELTRQLESNKKLKSLFKIGSVELLLNKEDMATYRQAFDDLVDALRNLNDLIIELADKAKEQELDARLRSMVEHIDDLLKQANMAKTYSDFVRAVEAVFDALETLLDQTKL